MIVVDTNVLSYFYLSSKYAAKAEILFESDPVWVAPILWRSEFRNVLSSYMRRNIIELNDAVEIFEAASRLLKENEYAVNAFKVLSLSKQSGCSAYDCEFVSLAQDLQVQLVTMDKEVLKSFPNTAVSLV